MALTAAVGVLAVVAAAFLFSRGSSASPVAWARLGTQDVHSLAFAGGGTDRLLFGHHDGVLESIDGGRSWRSLPVTQDAMTLAADGDGAIFIAGHNVFSASRDAGRTWQPVSTDLPGLDLHGFARDPADGRRMWAALASGGLWMSRDDGSHWKQVRVDNVLDPVAVSLPSGTRLLGLDITGLVASDDDGRTWTTLSAPPTYPLTALSASSDGAVVYAGSIDGLYRSADGGRSWTKTTYSGSVLAIAVSAGGDTIALVSQKTEFFRSPDRGDSWPGSR